MHENPAIMKGYFVEMATYTNDFDVEAQNDEALGLYRQLLEDERKHAKHEPSRFVGIGFVPLPWSRSTHKK